MNLLRFGQELDTTATVEGSGDESYTELPGQLVFFFYFTLTAATTYVTPAGHIAHCR